MSRASNDERRQDRFQQFNDEEQPHNNNDDDPYRNSDVVDAAARD